MLWKCNADLNARGENRALWRQKMKLFYNLFITSNVCFQYFLQYFFLFWRNLQLPHKFLCPVGFHDSLLIKNLLLPTEDAQVKLLAAIKCTLNTQHEFWWAFALSQQVRILLGTLQRIAEYSVRLPSPSSDSMYSMALWIQIFKKVRPEKKLEWVKKSRAVYVWVRRRVFLLYSDLIFSLFCMVYSAFPMQLFHARFQGTLCCTLE